jgi:hypothetical protein
VLGACGNKFFHKRVTENRMWKCISTSGSVMSTACTNLFIENTKLVFKNKKKLIPGKAHWLIARPTSLKSQVAHFLCKNRALRGIQNWFLKIEKKN